VASPEPMETPRQTPSLGGPDRARGLVPEDHREPRSRMCQRPEVLRAQDSSSELPEPGSDSRTREKPQAQAPP
jgi:hypothetical protein